MMKIFLPCLFLTSFSLISFGQTPDWSTGVAAIFYNNCTSCHHSGGIGPFALETYQDAVDNAANIRENVVEGEMPPWPADPSYRHFANEAILEPEEIAAITDWVDNGMPLGDISQAPPVPVFTQGGSLLDTIHHVVQIPPYTLQYNTDEYRYFAMHTGFTDTVYVSKIEVIPGLSQIVHHADIHYDLSGNSFEHDSITPLPGFNGGLFSNYYMNAWQPGGNIAEYPPNWGIAVPPGADFVLEIHYGPGGQGLTDTTRMNLRFITNPVDVRPIKVQWMLNNPIPSEGPLILPPNEITTFHQKSAPMPTDRSLISICPHMHMLGKSYRVWFISPQGDSVPLINIPEWNFHWQKYYMFQQVQKIPQGARIYAEASYDNTVNNPHNPNDPPITVTFGPTTEDEMLMTYFIYATYQPGDEDIVLDSSILVTTSVTHQPVKEAEDILQTYPNPAVDYFYVDVELSESKAEELNLLNTFGQLIETIKLNSQIIHQKIDISNYPAGIFYVELATESGTWVKKMLKLPGQ